MSDSLLREQASQALIDAIDAVQAIRDQHTQIRGVVAGFLNAPAVESRLGVCEVRLRDVEQAARELEASADRAHGLGIGEAG